MTATELIYRHVIAVGRPAVTLREVVALAVMLKQARKEGR